MEVMMYFSIILVLGFIAGRLISFFKLPVVTGYLVVGIVIGPYCINLIPTQAINSMVLLKHMALAFIAFFIGSEFERSQIKRIGNSVIVIATVQALTAVVLVFLTMYYGFHQPLSVSLLLGAISAATAPAAILMIIRQYKANGPLTKTLLSVVAMDDAICVIVFGITVSIVDALNNGSFLTMRSILEPFFEILGSAILGLAAAIITYILITRLSKSNDDILIIILAMLIGTTAIAYKLGLSYILTDMIFGGIIANTNSKVTRAFSVAEPIAQPIYVAFFTLAGVTLQLDLIPRNGLIGAGYILARAAGKMAGCYMGARLSKAPDVVRKFLGLGMLPQAGVAIGLALIVQEHFPDIGLNVSAIVMSGVVFYEILGPFFAKIAIEKSGEANV